MTWETTVEYQRVIEVEDVPVGEIEAHLQENLDNLVADFEEDYEGGTTSDVTGRSLTEHSLPDGEDEGDDDDGD